MAYIVWHGFQAIAHTVAGSSVMPKWFSLGRISQQRVLNPALYGYLHCIFPRLRTIRCLLALWILSEEKEKNFPMDSLPGVRIQVHKAAWIYICMEEFSSYRYTG